MDNELTLKEAQAIGSTQYSPVKEALFQISTAGYQFSPKEESQFRTDFQTWISSHSKEESDQARDHMQQLLEQKGCPPIYSESLLGKPIREIIIDRMDRY
ncbi:hypothetical protein ACQ4M3_39735 [Leptolyngbya sp. AN03gr2]|uniref:hypothetical protein n=1 Tax=unclassified Leptolyngbya TaxID=2650499 RepID=UPI003D316680